tara:strand:+ start:599 stop:1420 length:822 start_codon:yes stop_codon:yes gene_type:complete
VAGRRQRRLREQRRNPSSNGGDWGTKKDIEVLDPQRGIVLKSYREILEQQLAETLTHDGNAGDLIYQIAVLSLGIEARGGKAPKGMKRIKEQEPILREYFHGLDPRALMKPYHFFVFDDAQDEWLPSGFVSPEHFTHQRSHDLTMLEEYFFVAKHLGEEKYLPLIRAHYKKIREAHGLPKKNPLYHHKDSSAARRKRLNAYYDKYISAIKELEEQLGPDRLKASLHTRRGADPQADLYWDLSYELSELENAAEHFPTHEEEERTYWFNRREEE